MPVDSRSQRDRKRAIKREREKEREKGEREVVKGEGAWERVGGDKHVRERHTCVVADH